jgi:hypothetical protein
MAETLIFFLAELYPFFRNAQANAKTFVELSFDFFDFTDNQ